MKGDKALRLTLRLPEGVAFSYALAGPFTRFMSWLVDFAVIAAFWALLQGLFKLLSLLSPDIAGAVAVLTYFLVSTFYSISLEWLWDGQTLGKRFFKLRVMDARGLRLRFSQVLLRNLLRFVDTLPAAYALGGASASLSMKGRRLGDLAAGTVLIREAKVPIPDWAEAQAPKYNSLRTQRQLVARLRQNTDPREASIPLRALMRRDSLESGRRIELFRLISSHFKKKAAFPDEALEGLSDEQYLRNVVDLLFVSDTRLSQAGKA